MPAVIATHTSQGLTDGLQAVGSLEEAVQLEPEGIYTVARTYRRDHAVLLDAHLDRLEESARLEGMPMAIERAALRESLRQLVRRSGYDNSRFRITIPRADPGRAVISVEPLQELPPPLLAEGVRVAAVVLQRSNPRAKTNQWIGRRRTAQAALPEGVYEGLLVNPDGKVLEGLTSNFFGILKGTLHTAEKAVLMGIARKIVLTVAEEVVRLSFRALRVDELEGIEEAFLTSSSRGIVPIVAIDDVQIGGGSPGPRTRDLIARYDAWVESHLELI